MENQLLTAGTILPKSLQLSSDLKGAKISDLVKVIMIADLCRPNNSDILDAPGWLTVAQLVREDYPWLSVYDLAQIMKTGVKGHFDDFRQAPINSKTIFSWIERGKKDTWSYWRNRLMGKPAAVAILEDVYSQQELTKISKKIRTLDDWIDSAEKVIGDRYIQIVNKALSNVRGLSCEEIAEHAFEYGSRYYEQWRYLYDGILTITEPRLKKIKDEVEIKAELDELLRRYRIAFSRAEITA